MIANNSILEAKACARKYFRAASEDFKLLISFIKGINANKLISNPIQAPSQELAVIANSDPIIKINTNSNLAEFFFIKKKRIKTFMVGVWTQ